MARPDPDIVNSLHRPGNKITGGKVMNGETKRVANRAAQALRLAAAHKLAGLIYTMLTEGDEYTDQGRDYFGERYRERVVRVLSLRAERLGLILVAIPQSEQVQNGQSTTCGENPERHLRAQRMRSLADSTE